MTRLEQVLARELKGREIVVWGNVTRSLQRALRGQNFRTADINEQLDPAKHYLVAVNKDDLSDFQEEKASEAFTFADDYLTHEDPGGELPFEWQCHGVKIGRQTYFGKDIAGACEDGFVKSIGHFTSINSSADISVNHQLNMSFVSDDIARFFTAENKAAFDKKLKDDPRHPYALGKEPVTIGSDVYIGANVFINASRVTEIGHGAIIGSGAVVLEDVPPYAVVLGVPGKVKKYRYAPEVIEIFLRSEWWEWGIDEINENADALMDARIFAERFGGKGVNRSV